MALNAFNTISNRNDLLKHLGDFNMPGHIKTSLKNILNAFTEYHILERMSHQLKIYNAGKL